MLSSFFLFKLLLFFLKGKISTGSAEGPFLSEAPQGFGGPPDSPVLPGLLFGGSFPSRFPLAKCLSPVHPQEQNREPLRLYSSCGSRSGRACWTCRWTGRVGGRGRAEVESCPLPDLCSLSCETRILGQVPQAHGAVWRRTQPCGVSHGPFPTLHSPCRGSLGVPAPESLEPQTYI